MTDRERRELYRGAAAPRRLPDGGSIIVIAPPEVRSRIACIVSEIDVVGFNDLHELDLWRSGELIRAETIRADVEKTLSEVGLALNRLSVKMRAVLEAMSHERAAPSVIDLERAWPSRRSFYRAWANEMPIAPSAFLRRVRTVGAERLMTAGAAPKEAAIKAGFGSVDRLRRILALRRSEREREKK